MVSLYDFENKGIFFPGVHSSYKFSLFTAGNGEKPTSDRAEFVFFAHDVGELRAPDRRFTLSSEEIALLNPNTRTCPVFRSRVDAELIKGIYRRVPVLELEASDGQPRHNPWGIRFSTMFHMTNDSHLFRTGEELEADGWQLDGNVFRRDEEEQFPLYEAKMIHHFDHRWASYSETGGKLTSVDVPLMDKQNPDLTTLPRYWVEAREVYLRSADLPEGLLTSLRNRITSHIQIGLAHLLFAQWLRQRFGNSAEAAMQALFPSWIAFVEHHPFARELTPIQFGLCEDGPAAMKPPGPGWLPAVPLDEIRMDGRSFTTWYPVKEATLSMYLNFAAEYAHVGDALPNMHLSNENEALDFAEDLLVRTSPRWLLGCRDVTNSTNERTVVGGGFPLSAVGNNLPVWTSPDDSAVVLPVLFSTFACDFPARLKMGGTHLNFFIAKQIPVLSPEGFDHPAPWGSTDESLKDWLLSYVLELAYTAWDLAPFAADCGCEGPPFRWDEKRRFLLRCEVDAAFFHLYLPADESGNWRLARKIKIDGCPYDETPEQLAELTRHFPTPRDAVSYIMDTFPIVRRKDEKRYDEYRTKRVVLDIYDAMQEAASTGEPYQTLLDPPPADPRCCHPPRTISIDLAALPDGEWARPQGDEEEAETSVLAAVLKAIGGPEQRRTVRLAALLAVEPSLLVPSLTPEDASQWQRLIGPEATPRGPGLPQWQPPAAPAWGSAVRHLQGTGRLIEDPAAGTWAPGPGLEAIHTGGWPEGRVRMVMQTLRQRDAEEIARTLPALIRDWIDAEAA